MKFKQIGTDLDATRNLLLDENGDIWVGQLKIQGKPWMDDTYEYTMEVQLVEVKEKEYGKEEG